MGRNPVVAACGALALVASAFAQTPPENMTPEQIVRMRELGMKGQALFQVLKEPSRCGAETPKGYACALILYKDIREDRNRDRLPELLTVRVTGMTDAEGLAKDAKVRVLSPFDASPRTLSPMELPMLRMSISSTRQGQESASLEMQAVLGYAENEALPKDDKRRISRDRFKIPRENLQRF